MKTAVKPGSGELRSNAGRRVARAACVLCAAGALLVPLPGCAVNPATGQPQLALIGEGQEVQLGRQNHQQILKTMGVYQDNALQNYVQTLGRQLARGSERPSLPWTFTVLDDPTVNAFALPGGFIYVTRGILAHMNSEGELVGVLGHEIGHVTARHSVEQLSRAQIANMGLVLGSVVAPELQSMGGLVQQSVGLLLLKYSRDAERQADDLGVRYMTRNGYPASELGEILGVLDRVGRAAGQGQTPDWLSTHPNPGDRVARIKSATRGAAAPAARPGSASPADFLERLDGMSFGEDPREGYFDGDFFYHPGFEIELQLPRGWQKRNSKAALQAASPDGQAALQVSVAPGRSPRQAAEQFFQSQNGALQPGTAQNISGGGFSGVDVPFAVQQGARVVGRAVFVEDGQRVYQLLGYGIESNFRRYEADVDDAIGSLSRLRDRCRLSAEPARIELVRATRGMTVADLDRRGGGADPRAVAILNHVGEGAQLEAGRTYKVVRGGTRCR
jgi:predicted Zn-dependent protease